ncbi:hypothetical protein NQ318_016729 [Aromia moschata]|uniref:Maturase K n=1 Tax=Aromia moschata TaxID=1265417 RepID=A0AAV8XVZ6_9CUCU|nr:hypothetical protein NQ318_016729 [Aromia moschata]
MWPIKNHNQYLQFFLLSHLNDFWCQSDAKKVIFFCPIFWQYCSNLIKKYWSLRKSDFKLKSSYERLVLTLKNLMWVPCSVMKIGEFQIPPPLPVYLYIIIYIYISVNCCHLNLFVNNRIKEKYLLLLSKLNEPSLLNPKRAYVLDRQDHVDRKCYQTVLPINFETPEMMMACNDNEFWKSFYSGWTCIFSVTYLSKINTANAFWLYFLILYN